MPTDKTLLDRLELAQQHRTGIEKSLDNLLQRVMVGDQFANPPLKRRPL
ncbi:hypothetical protein [Mesorhizobium sp. M0500]